MDILIDQQPDMMINLSASPFDYIHDEERKSVIKSNVLHYKLPMFYCNAVGSQTEIVFDGASLVFDANGVLCKCLPSFEEAIVAVTLNDDGSIEESAVDTIKPISHIMPNPVKYDATRNIKSIHQALVAGIKDYFLKMGFTKAIIGSSGGIDSAVTLALACEALGKENVRAILMPSPYSSAH